MYEILWPVVSGAVTICVVLFFLAIHHRLSHSSSRAEGKKRIAKIRRLLLIIAHPDDEAMFFAPTILSISNGGSLKTSHGSPPTAHVDIHLLCLSSGGYRSQGPVRKSELRKSCAILGIPEENITVIEHSKLPDDPSKLWDRPLLMQIILRYVERLSADTIISFDGYGVSGHRNHSSIFRALQSLYSKGLLPAETQVFVLESVNILRKYSGIFDVGLSYLLSPYCYVVPWSGVLAGIRAMWSGHRSQLVWFRVLYVWFSRYMIMNTLHRINLSTSTTTSHYSLNAQTNLGHVSSNLMKNPPALPGEKTPLTPSPTVRRPLEPRRD